MSDVHRVTRISIKTLKQGCDFIRRLVFISSHTASRCLMPLNRFNAKELRQRGTSVVTEITNGFGVFVIIHGYADNFSIDGQPSQTDNNEKTYV